MALEVRGDLEAPIEDPWRIGAQERLPSLPVHPAGHLHPLFLLEGSQSLFSVLTIDPVHPFRIMPQGGQSLLDRPDHLTTDSPLPRIRPAEIDPTHGRSSPSLKSPAGWPNHVSRNIRRPWFAPWSLTSETCRFRGWIFLTVLVKPLLAWDWCASGRDSTLQNLLPFLVRLSRARILSCLPPMTRT